MKQSLLPLLRSPKDGSLLVLESSETLDSNEVITGLLRDGSGNQFPIIDGIPLFALEESQDETFSFKWELIGESYGYEEKTRKRRQDWYLERFGFETRQNLLGFLQDKALILDAGTGSGVDSAMFAESQSTVIAIDLSQQAALSTYRNLGHLPNVHVLQANLRNLPFGDRVFDYISCDQVIHHTPDPPSSFAALAKHLRLKGYMAIYVYKKKSPIREFTDDYIRQHTTQMSARECYDFCQSLTNLGKILSDLKVDIDIPTDIPLLEIQSGSYDIQRFFYWNVLKCFWNEEFDFVTNTVINFDWYHPKYAFRYTPEEFSDWFKKHHFNVKNFNVIPSGISILGQLKKE